MQCNRGQVAICQTEVLGERNVHREVSKVGDAKVMSLVLMALGQRESHKKAIFFRGAKAGEVGTHNGRKK